jgi:hypothetical protein
VDRPPLQGLDLTHDALAQRMAYAAVPIRKIETGEHRPLRQVAERQAECLQVPADQRAVFLQATRVELTVDCLYTPCEVLIRSAWFLFYVICRS